MTAAGCPANVRLRARAIRFAVTGHGPHVTELEIVARGEVLGEAENLAPGITSDISVTLEPRRYELLCPGGRLTERGTLVISR